MTMQKWTTDDCKNLLPQVLIDYLWQLADEGGDGRHSFALRIRYEGVGAVQDILYRHNSFSSWRRVFGYQPVEADVEVKIADGRAIMSLQGGSPGPGKAGGEEGWACSA